MTNFQLNINNSILFTGQKLLFPLVYFLLIPLGINAQSSSMRFENITVVDGLTENSARALHQDKMGFIWIGTQNGLLKYDGYEYTIYQHDPSDSTSIGDNRVTQIWEDNQGNIWVYLPSGEGDNLVSVLDRKTEKFRQYKNPFLFHQGWYDSVTPTSVLLTPDTLFCLSTRKEGLKIINLEGKLIKHLTKSTGLLSDSVSHIMYEEDHLIWIGYYNNGLSLYNYKKNQWIHYPLPFDHFANAATAIRNIQVYKDSLALINLQFAPSREFNIWALNLQDKTWELFHSDIKYNFNPVIFLDQSNNLWSFFSENSLLKKNILSKEQQYIPYSWDGSGESIKGAPRVYLEDRSGVIWIGTQNYGIYKWHPYQEKVKQIDIPQKAQKIHTVNGIQEDTKGNIWFGDDEGVSKIYGGIGNKAERLNSMGTISLFSDNKGTTWISNLVIPGINPSEIPLWSIDPESQNLIPHPLNELKKTFRLGFCGFTQDENGAIWLANCHRRGLFFYDPFKNKTKAYSHIPGDSTSLPTNVVSTILWDDDEDCLWVGTGYGGSRFCKFDPKTGIFQRFPLRPTKVNDFYIESIYNDRQKRLWVGSFSGLFWVDKNTGENKKYGLKQGLPQEIIYEIMEDDSGNYWLFHEFMISKLQFSEGDKPEILSIEVFDQSDGIPNERIFPYSISKSQDGRRAYFGGAGKISYFDFDQMKPSPVKPQLAFTHFKIKGKEVPINSNSPLKAPINLTQSIDLSHFQNDIAISFAALHFTQPKKNEYSFRLLPYENEWSIPSTKREAVYTNLDPGKYTLQVKGSNSDGIWNEEGISLKIVISPAWWETRLTYFFYFLSGIGLIWGFIRWRTHYLTINFEKRAAFAEATAAKAANEAKSKFLSTVSHELRTPLTSIIGFAKLNKKTLENKIIPEIKEEAPKVLKATQKINQNMDVVTSEGERLTSLINDLLDLAKIESGKVEWKMEPLVPKDLINRAINSTKGLLEQKPQIKLITDLPENSPILSGDKDRLLQVLINLISNAVKFTDQGHIKVGTKMGGESKNQELIFYVKDTGSGIPPDQLNLVFEKFKQIASNQNGRSKGTGLGLPICKEIVEHHGGKIWIESKEGEGSVFSFTIPISE